MCFFAHTPEQLRLVKTQHSPRSPKDSQIPKMLHLLAPPGTISPDESPPASPLDPMSEMVLSMRNLQLDRVKSLPRTYNVSGSCYGSPRGPAVLRPGFQSLPTTPTWGVAGPPHCELWETGSEDEPAMERVESGRSLRIKMFEKLSRENSLGRADADPSPDVGWVSELVM